MKLTQKTKGCIKKSFNPLLPTWKSMIARCENHNSKKYSSYGERGIHVCEEWQGEQGFINFCNWSLLYGWHRGLTLDRIDNDSNYCPENCRWVTIGVQNNNKRNVKRIEYSGFTFTISQLAQFIDVDYNILRHLLNDKKMPVDEAVEVAKQKGKHYVPYNELKPRRNKNGKRNDFYTTIVVKYDGSGK